MADKRIRAMKKNKSPSCSLILLAIVVFGVAAFFSHNALADGKFFPEKAYKTAPAIPTQRAILVYKDGTEKLTIESSLDGKGQEFGWIIPLPSKPTEFKEASPGLIKTLSLVIQPEIIHDLREKKALSWTIAIFVTFGCFLRALTKSSYHIILLLLVLFLIVLLFMFVPPLAMRSESAGVADIPGVKVFDIQEIGSYELAVLEAENSEALNNWLESNGFAGLSEDDRAIISDYIIDGWCFVAAKLRREEDGYSRPHPLLMSFATDAPIYPVRLTATMGSDVYLELFVIADRRAICEKLTLEVSDKYILQRERISSYSGIVSLAALVSNSFGQEIGHPAAQEHMWDGCVLSKLSGTLKPKQMMEDLALHLKSGEAYRKQYYSHHGARDTGLTFSLGLWSVTLIVLTALFFRERHKGTRRLVFLSHVVGPALVFSLLTWALVYAMLPKVDIRKAPHRFYDQITRKKRTIEISILAEEHNHFAGMSKDEIGKLLDDYYVSKSLTNGFTGEPIKHEDSPGNYILLEDDRGIVWRTYSLEGYPDDYVLTSSLQD
jgi:hypothetical protein